MNLRDHGFQERSSCRRFRISSATKRPDPDIPRWWGLDEFGSSLEDIGWLRQEFNSEPLTMIL